MKKTTLQESFGGLKTKIYLFFVIFILVPFLIYNLYERRLGYSARESLNQWDRVEICVSAIKEWQMTLESNLHLLSVMAVEKELKVEDFSLLAGSISAKSTGINSIQFVHQDAFEKRAFKRQKKEEQPKISLAKEKVFKNLADFVKDEHRAAFFFQNKSVLIFYPVLRTDLEKKDAFLGFLVASTPLANFTKVVGIDKFIEEGIPFRLTYLPEDTDTVFPVIDSDEAVHGEIVTRYVDLPQGRLKLEIAPAQGWYDTFLRLTDMLLVATLIILLIGIAIVFGKVQVEKQKYEELSEKDTLTGLYNRRKFVEVLKKACAAREKFVLCYIDFDRFKAINDTYGHAVGDFFLKESGKRLIKILGTKGTLFRLGGDEFAIFLKRKKEHENFSSYVEEIKESMKKPFIIGDISLGIELSIGFVYAPEEGKDAETLLQMADVRMYVEKNRQKYLHDAQEGGELHAKD